MKAVVLAVLLAGSLTMPLAAFAQTSPAGLFAVALITTLALGSLAFAPGRGRSD